MYLLFIYLIRIIKNMINPRKLVFVNIYSTETLARYLLSSYVLKSYLRKFLSEKDLDIEILNFSNYTEETKILETIIEKNPNYVGYSCYIWNIEKIIKVAKKIREKTSLIIHIFGGPEISEKRILTMPRKIADYYILSGKKIYEMPISLKDIQISSLKSLSHAKKNERNIITISTLGFIVFSFLRLKDPYWLFCCHRIC